MKKQGGAKMCAGKEMIAAVTFLLTCLLSLPAEAKNLYINNSGSPTCSDATTYANNSSSSPWCTLLRAVRGNADGNRNTAGVSAQAAQAGDTVYVTAGTYNYSGAAFTAGSWLGVLYDPINSGTPGAWITFEAVGTVHITGNRSGRSSMIGSNSSQYIKWIGFTLNEATSSYRNGIVTATADNVWFERNTIVGYAGDIADNHPGIMVHGPRAGDCTGGISNITIRNNSISGFRGIGGRNDAGITLYCLGSNILIENNDIYGNVTGINAKSNYVDNENIVVRRNTLRNNTGDAIAMQAFSDWHVYQNIMQNNRTGFLFFNTTYFVGNAKPNDIHIINNTMYGNAIGIYFKSLCQNLGNNHVKNNLIVGSNNIIYVDSVECSTPSNMVPSKVHFEGNTYGYSGVFYSDDASNQVTSYENWRSSYGQSATSLNGTNPLFVDAAGGDFRLQSGSPARSVARDVLDLNGNGSTTDLIAMGAYITGDEVIGLIPNSLISAPTGLRAIPVVP